METLQFLTEKQIQEIVSKYGNPVFVYSQKNIIDACQKFLDFPNAFGLTVRFAMKANSNVNILNLIRKQGIHIDASSGYEAERAILSGFEPDKILVSSQEFPKNIQKSVWEKIHFNACSLQQIEEFGKIFPNKPVGLRFNPGLGSGATKKTNVGGTTSSFGIWYEEIENVKNLISHYKLKTIRIHTHIGSGSDEKIWTQAAKLTLDIARKFPECRIVDLGGGYKIGRMKNEKTTNLQEIGKIIRQLFQEHHQKYNQKLHLEIEPGTYLMANSGSLICQVNDKVNTGKNGYEFIKLNVGMDSITRPVLYGSEHPIVAVHKNKKTQKYVFVGHCCESGDVLTQREGGELLERETDSLEIGDPVVIEGVGAYCSSMCLKNYNSFPEIPEVLLDSKGETHLIRKKQTLQQIIQNEIKIDL